MTAPATAPATAPEFSRPVRLDTLGGQPRAMTIEADPDERAALARRFALPAIDRLVAIATLVREGDAVSATGRIEARVTQSCVATGAPVPAAINVALALRFVPEAAVDADEIELSAEDCDTIPYAGGAIDLGEAAAEEMALALAPFPRSPDAEQALKAAGVVGEEDVGPFAVLKALKRQG